MWIETLLLQALASPPVFAQHEGGCEAGRVEVSRNVTESAEAIHIVIECRRIAKLDAAACDGVSAERRAKLSDADRRALYSRCEEVRPEAPPDPLPYVLPDRKTGALPDRPSIGRMLKALLSSQWTLYTHRTTEEEKKRIEEIKRLIDATPSGRELVAQLGGWSRIEDETLIKFGGTMPNALAQAQVLGWLGSRWFGKPFALTMGTDSLSASPEAAALTFIHELSHVRDFQDGRTEFGLQIPSEYGAHRRQIYMFEDLRRTLDARRLSELASDPDWEETRFVAALWEDRITARYSKRQFAEQFKGLKRLAWDAYHDVATGTVPPGSPHLDHHIFADPKRGLYRRLTYATDVIELPPASQKPEVLDERAAMVAAQQEADQRFRRANGFEVP